MTGIWTRNYYNLLTSQILCDDTQTSSSQPSSYDPPVMLRTVAGAWYNSPLSDSAAMGYTKNLLFNGKGEGRYGWAANVIPGGGFGVGFGSGSTPASYDDYALQSPISSGISGGSVTGALTQASAYDSDTHKISSIRSYTFTNSSASNITVRELGLFTRPISMSTNIVMIYHEVFDEDIVLEPGESIILDIKREAEVFNYIPY